MDTPHLMHQGSPTCRGGGRTVNRPGGGRRGWLGAFYLEKVSQTFSGWPGGGPGVPAEGVGEELGEDGVTVRHVLVALHQPVDHPPWGPVGGGGGNRRRACGEKKGAGPL